MVSAVTVTVLTGQPEGWSWWSSWYQSLPNLPNLAQLQCVPSTRVVAQIPITQGLLLVSKKLKFSLKRRTNEPRLLCLAVTVGRWSLNTHPEMNVMRTVRSWTKYIDGQLQAQRVLPVFRAPLHVYCRRAKIKSNDNNVVGGNLKFN